MIKRKLLNCDFFGASGFVSNLSNKAKLLYFMFFVNADDRGFVGNGLDIANSLDRTEESFENVLFNITYIDAIQELVDKRLLYEFVDKVGNRTYLIKHYFKHQSKDMKYYDTNFVSYLAKVELVDDEYYLRETIKEKNLILKGKENKGKVRETKSNKSYVHKSFNDIDIDTSITSNLNNELQDNSWEDKWEQTLKELERE